MSNPFEEADPWEVSTDTLLPVGNHVVSITEAEDDTNSKGNPTLALKFENAAGSIKDWEHYSETFLRKIVALYQHAGLEIPQEGEFDPDDHCRLTGKKRAQLVGKKIGIVVREEPRNDDPSKMQKRVQGFVDPSQIDADLPVDASPYASVASSVDDDIPF